MTRKPVVVIVGCGFGGLNAARALKHAAAEVIIIDKSNHHLFQPLLYQTATATLSSSDISTPIREIFAKQKNTRVIMGEVTAINKEEKFVLLENGDQFSYDYLVIAVGAHHSYFGNDRWEKFAPGIKSLKDALTIREHLLMAFEKAERLKNVGEAYPYLTFVIVGGGPTGVEFAGSIAELITKTLKRNFRSIRTETARIILIEGSDRLLPPFPSKLSAKTKTTLEKMGVTVLTNRTVTDINENGVQVGDTFIEAKTVIWAAGNTVPKVIKTLGIEQDRQGRAIVNCDLSIPKHPEIFVIGDAAHFKTPKDKILPGVATVAIQEGKFVGKLLNARLKKKRNRRKVCFSYFDKGSLATIGTWKAVASVRGFNLSGFFAWFIWGFVHIAYLISFRNRLSVMLQWALHIVTKARSSRIIYGTIDEKLPKQK